MSKKLRQLGAGETPSAFQREHTVAPVAPVSYDENTKTFYLQQASPSGFTLIALAPGDAGVFEQILRELRAMNQQMALITGVPITGADV